MKLNLKSINKIYIISFLVICIIIIVYIILKMDSYEGFKAPQFKDQQNNKLNNPLKNFGFKYDKNERFNNGTNSKLQNALDEVDRLDVNSINFGNAKSVLHEYNNNITKKLKKYEKFEGMDKLINQSKIFYDEFINLFDLELLI